MEDDKPELALKRLELESKNRVVNCAEFRLNFKKPNTKPLSVSVVDHLQHNLEDVLEKLVRNLTLSRFEVAPINSAPAGFHRL